MLITGRPLKTFQITAKVDLNLKKMLPTNMTRERLIDYSWLKTKKRWKNNRRLTKKFVKNFYKYIPHWVACEWANLPIQIKAMNELLQEEDRRLLELVRKENENSRC